MLQLLVRDLDICRVSKILGKNRLKSYITTSTIIIDSDEISDDVVQALLESSTIIMAQNYYSSIVTTSAPEKSSLISEVSQVDSNHAKPDLSETEENLDKDSSCTTLLTEEISQEPAYVEETFYQHNHEEKVSESYAETSTNLVLEEEFVLDDSIQTLNSQNFNRGEIYELIVHEHSRSSSRKVKKCVIILNNTFDGASPNHAIGLVCANFLNKDDSFKFSFRLNPSTLEIFNPRKLKGFKNTSFVISHIVGINAKILGKYLGKATDAFMNSLQPAIDHCLGIERSRTVNWAQLQILSTVNMEDLFAISDAKISNSEKVTAFLELFSFDMSKKGMEYVKKAILIASTKGDYHLEDLAYAISKEEQVETYEVLRMIVARIKEHFCFKKSPAISFIRLIDKLLKKG